MTPADRPALHAAIRAFIAGGPGELEPLALALHADQVAANPALAALSSGVRARSIETIPAVPVPLFRDLDLRAFGGDPAVVFRTSGTTTGGAARGTHALRDTLLYDLGARAHYRAMVPDAPGRVVSLVSHAPDSSLGHMTTLFADTLLPFFTDGQVDPAAWAALDQPCFLATTAFALDALLAFPGRAGWTPGAWSWSPGGSRASRSGSTPRSCTGRCRASAPCGWWASMG